MRLNRPLKTSNSLLWSNCSVYSNISQACCKF